MLFKIGKRTVYLNFALLYAPTEKLPRKTLEKKIIFELGTITPSGLNKF